MTNEKEIEKRLEKLLKTSYEPRFDQEEITIINKHTKQVSENFRLWNQLYNIMAKSKKPAAEDSLCALLSILFLTEGPLGFIIDTIVYNLMLRGHHDIWYERGQKFISSFDELIHVPSFVKLKFLKEHGFNSVSKKYPRKIRNAVAHQEYKIQRDGSVDLMQKGKPREKFTKRQLDSIINEIIELMVLTTQIIYKEYV